MKRYLIFMYETYYPKGGANDFVGFADTKEEIKDVIIKEFNNPIKNLRENINIFDTKTGHIYGTTFDNPYDFVTDEYELNETYLDEVLEELYNGDMHK